MTGITRRHVGFLMLLVLVAAVVPMSKMYDEVHYIRLDAALFKAVEHNRTEEALLLLKQGANANATRPRNSNISFVQFVLNKLNIKTLPIEDNNQQPTVLLAALSRCPPQHAYEETNPLPENVRLIQALLDHGADPNGVKDVSLLIIATMTNKHKTAELLIAHGADVNAVEGSGYTPILYATENGDVSLVKELLNKKADSDMPNEAGQTPLFYAVILPKPAGIQMVRLLLAYGADPNASNKRGATVLDVAMNYQKINDPPCPEVIQMLIKAGARRGMPQP